LVLYDAEGDFDRNFDWWKASGKHRVVEPQLPFENGRSDLDFGRLIVDKTEKWAKVIRAANIKAN
jgi:hypothetical protein